METVLILEAADELEPEEEEEGVLNGGAEETESLELLEVEDVEVFAFEREAVLDAVVGGVGPDDVPEVVFVELGVSKCSTL